MDGGRLLADGQTTGVSLGLPGGPLLPLSVPFFGQFNFGAGQAEEAEGQKNRKAQGHEPPLVGKGGRGKEWRGRPSLVDVAAESGVCGGGSGAWFF